VKQLSSKRFDHAVRMEVLRTRAAIERESFAAQIEQLSVQTSPAYMLGSLLQFRRKSWLKNQVISRALPLDHQRVVFGVDGTIFTYGTRSGIGLNSVAIDIVATG